MLEEILKKKFKVDKEDIIRYYRDTDWEREYLGEKVKYVCSFVW